MQRNIKYTMDQPEDSIDIKALESFLITLKNRLGLLGAEVIYDTGENRLKNKLFLEEMGWVGTMRRDRLLLLEKEDYFQGPLPNDDKYGEDIWVFGKRFNGRLCYIKIYLLKPPNNVFCISFHFAEHDMYLPLRKITERI